MILVWETDSGELESIEFDATTREVHDAGAVVTEHPVETGANIADHVRPTIVKASFDCFVSDSPVEVPTTQMYGTSGSVRSVSLDGGKRPELVKGANRSKPAEYEQRSTKGTAQVLKFDGEFSRVGRVYEQLEQLRKDATLLTTTTMLDTLENVVMTKLSAPQTAKDGDGITFAIELTQVRFAESQIVEVPEPVDPRGRRSSDAGATATAEVPEESIWHRLALGS